MKMSVYRPNINIFLFFASLLLAHSESSRIYPLAHCSGYLLLYMMSFAHFLCFPNVSYRVSRSWWRDSIELACRGGLRCAFFWFNILSCFF